MIVRIILAFIIAVVVGILVNLIGKALVDSGVVATGSYLDAVSVILAIAAGVWYFFSGSDPVRRI